MSRRRAGSVRFDPYWKIQWWDATSLAWRDLQEAIHDEEIAIVSARAEATHRQTSTRLMRITETGREPTREVRWPAAEAEEYCATHDLYNCPFAHDPRRIR